MKINLMIQNYTTNNNNDDGDDDFIISTTKSVFKRQLGPCFVFLDPLMGDERPTSAWSVSSLTVCVRWMKAMTK